MSKKADQTDELCVGCVYFPPNLPSNAYDHDDWLMLQERSCSYDYHPSDADCLQTRKTSCSIVDLGDLPQPSSTQEDN